jgi:outer membrane protein TolC
VGTVSRPQLNRWVQQALAHNQGLAQAEANVQAMLAGIGEFDARRWPSTAMGVAATYGRSADDQTLAEATDSNAPSQWQFNPGIELAYQVDIWGQVRAAIQRARVQAEASAAALDLVRLQVVAQTTRAYIDQCTYAARLEAAKQALQTLDHSVQLSQRQRQAGVATALDSERLLGLREQVRAQLPMLSARRQMALYELELSGQASVAEANDLRSHPHAVGAAAGWRWLAFARAPARCAPGRTGTAGGHPGDRHRAGRPYPKVSFGASLTSSTITLPTSATAAR